MSVRWLIRRSLVGRTVRAWESAVVANGGSVSSARRQIIETFVHAEISSGSFYLTDDYWLLAAESSVQALTSLKRRTLATAVNTPTFTVDRQYAFDGSTNYLNTGFVPSTHGINLTGANLRLAAYERVNLGASAYAAGTRVGTNPAIGLIPRGSTSMTGVLNNITTSANFLLGVADSRGLKAVSRAGGTTMLGYDRGVRLTDVTGLTVDSSSRPSVPLMIGAYNSSNTPISFRAASIGFVCIGGPLSDAQEAAQYAAVQAWMTSLGAQV